MNRWTKAAPSETPVRLKIKERPESYITDCVRPWEIPVRPWGIMHDPSKTMGIRLSLINITMGEHGLEPPVAQPGPPIGQPALPMVQPWPPMAGLGPLVDCLGLPMV